MASCFCFNLQLVKRLHHLRHLQLLVQVLKAPDILKICFPVAFLSKTEKGGGGREELVTVDKRHWTCHDLLRTPFNNLSVNGDLIRFRCARDKNSTTCVCLRWFPSDEELCLDVRRRLASIQWLAPSDFLVFMRFYEAMLHSCWLMLISFFIGFRKYGVSEIPKNSSQLPKPSHEWPQGGHRLFPDPPGLCARQSLLGFVWRWRLMWIKVPGRCGIFEQAD